MTDTPSEPFQQNLIGMRYETSALVAPLPPSLVKLYQLRHAAEEYAQVTGDDPQDLTNEALDIAARTGHSAYHVLTQRYHQRLTERVAQTGEDGQ